MRKFLLLLAGYLFASLSLVAQSKNVTGKVSDDQGNPVANASVVVKGTTIGTATKTDGSFSLTLPPNAKQLEISFIGMVTQTINITNGSNYSVSLISESKEIGEAVVIGVGIGSGIGAGQSARGSPLRRSELHEQAGGIAGRHAGGIGGLAGVKAVIHGADGIVRIEL